MMISRFWRWGINAAGSGPKRQLHSITNKNRNINRISSRKWVGHIVLNRRRPPLLLVLDEVLRQPVMWWRMRPWCCLCVILDGKLKLSSWSKSFVALRPLFIFALCSKDQGMYMYYVCVCVCAFVYYLGGSLLHSYDDIRISISIIVFCITTTTTAAIIFIVPLCRLWNDTCSAQRLHRRHYREGKRNKATRSSNNNGKYTLLMKAMNTNNRTNTCADVTL